MRNEGSRWAGELGNAAPGTRAFNNGLRDIAAREPQAFRDAQHAFIERTHYALAVAAVTARTGLDLNGRADAVRDATWSVSVQHGGAATILNRAVAATDARVARTDPKAGTMRVLTGAFVLLSAAACDMASAPAARNSEAARPVEAAPGAAPAVQPRSPRPADAPVDVPAQIDPAPTPTAAPRIVESDDIRVQGEAACAFTIRYGGAVDQPVTWNGEACDAVTTRFLSEDALRRLGKIDRLSPETLADIRRTSGRSAFYVEGAFSASIYPINSAGRVYEVPVAD